MLKKGGMIMYRKDTVVISVPISLNSNRKLYELAVANACKSKTQLAKKLLEQAIDAKCVQKEEKNGTC